MSTHNHHGVPMKKTQFIHARVSEEQKKQYLALGGTAWLEKKLAEEKDKKDAQ